MVDPAVDVVLLSSVALRGLIVVPRLLLRSLPLSASVVLSRSVLRRIGTTVRIMTMSTTLETHDDPSRGCVVVPHGSAYRGVLAILLGSGALSRLLILLVLLVLLSWALVLILILTKTNILSSWVVLVFL